ncbi:MAG: prepilin peptidase [Lachnospiraceae bacterium]|nr:prepilin peptidase [Lachnospiraceae bacterium]
MYAYLAGAAICACACAGDIRDYKIPNGLILLGYAVGSFYTYLSQGSSFFPAFAWNALWPLLLLYFLFYIGCLGSGDVKLVSVLIPLLMNGRAGLYMIALSFFIGGIFAFVKMLFAGDLLFRLSHLFAHVRLCILQKKPIPYVPAGRCRELHFAISISISYIIIIFHLSLFRR